VRQLESAIDVESTQARERGTSGKPRCERDNGRSVGIANHQARQVGRDRDDAGSRRKHDRDEN
jgi:hypothetical protein